MSEIVQEILIPFFGTTLGAACVFIMGGGLHEKVQRALIGFASGVMTAASVWSLLIPAMEQAEQMGRRAFRRKLDLFRQGGFDILLTHAPAYDLNDGDDLAHTGFDAFNTLMDRYNPKYFVHGHIHMNYGANIPRLSSYHNTQVINAYQSYTFEY